MRTVAASLVACMLLTLTACKQNDPPAPAATPATSPAPAASATPSLVRGAKAPEFSLEGSDGKTHTLAEHAGKEAVVIAWFPKAFTGG